MAYDNIAILEERAEHFEALAKTRVPPRGSHGCTRHAIAGADIGDARWFRDEADRLRAANSTER